MRHVEVGICHNLVHNNCSITVVLLGGPPVKIQIDLSSLSITVVTVGELLEL